MKFPKDMRVDECAAREPGHYAINGVLVERTKDGAGRAVASDGRRLVVAPVELEADDDVDVSRIVPLEAFKAARAGAVKGGCRIELNGAAKARAKGGGVASFPYVDGEFPRYADIVPEAKPDGPALAFNAEYLAGIQRALGALSVRLQIPVDARGRIRPTEPIRITGSIPDGTVQGACRESDAVAVLMPVTFETDTDRRGVPKPRTCLPADPAAVEAAGDSGLAEALKGAQRRADENEARVRELEGELRRARGANESLEDELRAYKARESHLKAAAPEADPKPKRKRKRARSAELARGLEVDVIPADAPVDWCPPAGAFDEKPKPAPPIDPTRRTPPDSLPVSHRLVPGKTPESIGVKFEAKPSEEIRAALKAAGFRWYGGACSTWFGPNSKLPAELGGAS